MPAYFPVPHTPLSPLSILDDNFFKRMSSCEAPACACPVVASEMKSISSWCRDVGDNQSSGGQDIALRRLTHFLEAALVDCRFWPDELSLDVLFVGSVVMMVFSLVLACRSDINAERWSRYFYRASSCFFRVISKTLCLLESLVVHPGV